MAASPLPLTKYQAFEIVLPQSSSVKEIAFAVTAIVGAGHVHSIQQQGNQSSFQVSMKYRAAMDGILAADAITLVSSSVPIVPIGPSSHPSIRPLTPRSCPGRGFGSSSSALREGSVPYLGYIPGLSGYWDSNPEVLCHPGGGKLYYQFSSSCWPLDNLRLPWCQACLSLLCGKRARFVPSAKPSSVQGVPYLTTTPQSASPIAVAAMPPMPPQTALVGKFT